MSNPFVAEIRPFAFNFAPTGWAQCNGQILPISQNTALFSLLGTNYGGDGRSTFALPNLQSSIPVHAGQGPGLQLWSLAQTQGSDTVTLLSTEMPAHSHAPQAANVNATTADPSGNVIAKGAYGSGSQRGAVALYQTAGPNTTMNTAAVLPAGSGQPHNNLMPFCVVNHCIALQGVFPPRP